jgi:hypothetical protein
MRNLSINEYKKNTCGYCLNWKPDDIIGITGRCYSYRTDFLIFHNDERCSSNYRENTTINNLK